MFDIKDFHPSADTFLELANNFSQRKTTFMPQFISLLFDRTGPVIEK